MKNRLGLWYTLYINALTQQVAFKCYHKPGQEPFRHTHDYNSADHSRIVASYESEEAAAART